MRKGLGASVGGTAVAVGGGGGAEVFVGGIITAVGKGAFVEVVPG